MCVCVCTALRGIRARVCVPGSRLCVCHCTPVNDIGATRTVYKRTGGRKLYDFIGRVGQLSRVFFWPPPVTTLGLTYTHTYARRRSARMYVNA